MKSNDLAELQKAAEEVALVPSPAEMQNPLSNAGLTSDLAELVSAERNIGMDVEDKDNMAVRTGVVLADLGAHSKDCFEGSKTGTPWRS